MVRKQKKQIKKVEPKEEIVEPVVEEQPVEEVSKKEFVAIYDISLKYHTGDIVPDEVVADWKRRGIKTELMVK